MNVQVGYFPASAAAKILNVSGTTLQNWAENGTIHYYRNGERGKRWYNVKEFLDRNCTDRSAEPTEPIKRRIVYARVSTRGQKDDLERQCQYLQSRYPNHELITDIGSGLNYKRKGLKTILDYAIKGSVQELVVAHKDRLCRFGFELIEWIVSTFSKGTIVVLDNHKSSPQEEMCSDILSIITVFGARINGLKKYKPILQNELEKREVDEDNQNTNPTDTKTETNP
jgi:predicted site-specific integrase-resolvase